MSCWQTSAELVILLDHLNNANHIRSAAEADMTSQINIAEAKAKLSELLDRALAGEEIVIARAGKPLARLVPVEELNPRQPGLLRDWQVPDDLFLEPADPEDLDAAEGKHTDAYGITLPNKRGR